jgi:hypothetical protein
MENIEIALIEAKKPGEIYCPECQEKLFAPMEKLCINLYGKCSIHLEDDSIEQKNLLNISQGL